MMNLPKKWNRIATCCSQAQSSTRLQRGSALNRPKTTLGSLIPTRPIRGRTREMRCAPEPREFFAGETTCWDANPEDEEDAEGWHTMIYAMRRTGLVLDQFSYVRLVREERDAYDRAIDEYVEFSENNLMGRAPAQ